MPCRAEYSFFKAETGDPARLAAQLAGRRGQRNFSYPSPASCLADAETGFASGKKLIRNQGYEGSGSAWIRIKGIAKPQKWEAVTAWYHLNCIEFPNNRRCSVGNVLGSAL